MAAVDHAPMSSGSPFQRRLSRPATANNTHVNDAASRRSSTTSFPTSLHSAPTRSTAASVRQSFQRTDSEVRHDDYIAKLEVPTLDQISSIAQIQEEKEREVQQKYHDGPSATEEQAAERIQRTYRGHRARRQMQGLTLDPTTRWIEALKAARYQNITNPGRRRQSNATIDDRPSTGSTSGSRSPNLSLAPSKLTGARSNWHHVSSIASHAIGDLPQRTSESSTGRLSRDSSKYQHGKPTGDDETGLVPKEDVSSREKRKQKIRNSWAGKAMDLPYFLEMVDQKHRYGSNLRAYHELWMKSDTTQPYFWWLDHGDGKEVEHPNVSRATLEREQVRYLSREERMNYLVHIDDQGRLIWAKNGKRLTTSTEYRDSLEGIVSTESDVKAWREDEIKALQDGEEPKRSSSDGWSSHSGSPPISPLASPDLNEAERRYPDPPDLRESKGSKKLKNVSAQALLNRLLRKTLVAQNTWIFAVDTSMNLYCGIKQSGSFQHSSFMRGSRLSAAGTIKIKDGQLRAINPLSGHYRPPAKAFRHFVHHLEDIHVDMSRVSISKSYAVLVGLEAYISTRKKAKKVTTKVKHGADMVLHPAKTKERKDKEKDMSKSAQKEREREREEKGPLGRVLEDAKTKVEERWAALDARRTEDKSPADVQQVPEIPEPDVPHQESLDRPYKEPSADGGLQMKSGHVSGS